MLLSPQCLPPPHSAGSRSLPALPGEVQAGAEGAVKQAGMFVEWQQHPKLQCLPGQAATIGGWRHLK